MVFACGKKKKVVWLEGEEGGERRAEHCAKFSVHLKNDARTSKNEKACLQSKGGAGGDEREGGMEPHQLGSSESPQVEANAFHACLFFSPTCFGARQANVRKVFSKRVVTVAHVVLSDKPKVQRFPCFFPKKES